MKSKAKLKNWGRLLGDFLYPRDCLLTGEPVGESSDWGYFERCSLDELGVVQPPFCRRCGAPFYGELALSLDCAHCRQLERTFDEGRTCMTLRGVGRELIHALKYHEASYLLADIGRIIEKTPKYVEFLRGAHLVPVPLHSVKERQRGFNQSVLLAQLMARIAPEAVFAPLLVRTRNTKTQTRLNHEERHRNVRDAFALKPKAVVESEQRYIVIDDVLTTGATLNACSSVLKEAGAEHVDVATLGHG